MLTCLDDLYGGLNNYSSGSCIRGANDSAICINDAGLLNNTLTCGDSYCLNAYDWKEPKITLDETFADQIAAQVAKKLSKQMDPLEKKC